jgi:hypothetical protein
VRTLEHDERHKVHDRAGAARLALGKPLLLVALDVLSEVDEELDQRVK